MRSYNVKIIFQHCSEQDASILTMLSQSLMCELISTSSKTTAVLLTVVLDM